MLEKENMEIKNNRELPDNLHDFGLEFQTKCVASLVTDRAFLERVYEILSPKFFEREAEEWIVNTIKNYFLQYKAPPSLNVFKVEVDAIEHDVLKKSVVDQLRQVYNHIGDDDLQYVKDQFLSFAKTQTLARAVLECADLVFDKKRQHEINGILDRAQKAAMEKNIGHDYFEDIAIRMSEMARYCIPTGWDVMDDLMDGGLGKGELGFVVAPAGSGKSWLLARLGCEAMKRGKNVIHFTLELNENYVGLRYDACFSGISFQDVRDHVDVVKSKIYKPEHGKLFIKYFPLKTASAQTIKMYIERIQMIKGVKIDLCVIDYADLLTPLVSQKNANSYSEAGSVYEELRTIAGELQIPIWSASQSHRGAHEEEVIQAHNVADSYRKIMTGDFVFSLSRTMDDKNNNTARIHIIKNRFGADGMTYPSKFDASNGTIILYEPTSGEGQEMSRKMKSGDDGTKKKMRDIFNGMSRGQSKNWNSQRSSSQGDENEDDDSAAGAVAKP